MSTPAGHHNGAHGVPAHAGYGAAAHQQHAVPAYPSHASSGHPPHAATAPAHAQYGASAQPLHGPGAPPVPPVPVNRGLVAPEYPADAPPPRVQWSLVLFAAGGLAMAVSLALVFAGVPAAMLYDADGPGEINKNTSWDPFKMSRSIDLNMKYITENTGYEPDEYNGLLRSISRSEDSIPVLATGLTEMTANVESIQVTMENVGRTTKQMRLDMNDMSTASQGTARTLQQLDADVRGFSGALGSIVKTTRQLTGQVDSIDRKATTIAGKRIPKVLDQAREINQAMPEGIPEPRESMVAFPEGAV